MCTAARCITDVLVSTNRNAHWPLLRAAHELFYTTVVPDILNYTGSTHMNFKGFDAADPSVRGSIAAAQVL